MKKVSLKLIAAALVTTMLIPMGAASASEKPGNGNKNKETKITVQYNSDEEDTEEVNQAGKWDWKIEKEKAKAETKIEKEKAKAEWKIEKEKAKAEVKKTREEVKKELQEQKTEIKQNNDKTKDLREEIIDQKQAVSEVIEYLRKNNIVIPEDISKQITESLENIKADIEAINSSKGVINNIYVDIKAQLENKDANAVQTGIENVLSIQDQRYLSLKKLYDDLQILLNLLEHVKENPQTETPAVDNSTTTPAAGTPTDGQATVPAAGSETNTQSETSTDTTAPSGTTNDGQASQTDTTTVPTQTTEVENPATGS